MLCRSAAHSERAIICQAPPLYNTIRAYRRHAPESDALADPTAISPASPPWGALMAARIFLAVAALVGVMWYLTWYRRANPAQRNRSVKTILLYGAAAAILVLVLTGRIHWLFAAFSAVIPWLNRALTARQLWKTFSAFRQGRGEGGGPRAGPPGGGAMDIAEAYEVLGLSPGATEREIIDAHRNLMHKIHPDRGGSDYLAARINQAKEVLLKAL